MNARIIGSCSVPACEKPIYVRGYCTTHYNRWRTHGDPTKTLYIRGDDTARFWSRVDKSGPIPAHNPSLGSCWEWTAGIADEGYGLFRFHGKVRKAHRVSYEFAYGPIVCGDVDHRCRNRRCVRPDHLRLATNKQNHENRHVDSSNTSGYRGVSWHKGRGKWWAYVTHNGKRVSGGYFSDVHEAGQAAKELRNSLFTHNEMDRIAQ